MVCDQQPPCRDGTAVSLKSNFQISYTSMPTLQPTISYQELRKHMEQWTWKDPRTGVEVTGFNVPDAARKTARQKPFFFRAISIKGEVIEGTAICLKVFLREHQRMVKFTGSGQVRRIRDYLVMEVNGIRVITH